MKIDIILKNIMALILIGVLFGCQSRYSVLLTKIQNVETQAALVRWVDNNVAGKKVDDIATWVGGAPGAYKVNARFDWGMLGMRSNVASVKLLVNGEKKVLAVYFGEHGRLGVLVKMGDTYGVVSDDVKWQKGRIALYKTDDDINI